MQKLPGHGVCFVCGDNPRGIGITWYVDGDEIYAEFTLTEAQQGPPNHVHGGASAAILDEAMGAAVWKTGLRAVAANLEVDYRRPVPLGEKVSVRARVTRRGARKLYARGQIYLPDGTLAVEGRGIYVPAKLVENVKFEV
jgi:uncharacterized protein (TIGR00369 family)